jgi:hypothetical protein
VEPEPEPPQPPPVSFADLLAFDGHGVPQLQPAPHPSQRDVAIVPHIFLAAALPERHTLPVDPEAEGSAVWYGTVPRPPVHLIVRERVEISFPALETRKVDEIEAWHIDRSIWRPRRRTADSRTYWDSPEVYERAFELDWARCSVMRFRRMLGVGDDAEGDSVLESVKRVLKAHVETIYAAFRYYSSLDQSHDGYQVGLNSFTMFVTDCRIADKDSNYCRLKDLDMLFILANFEDRSHEIGLDEAALNAVNADHALMRFEFVQVLARIAIDKFLRDRERSTGAKRTGAAVADAVQLLLSKFVATGLPPYAALSSNTFRDWKLYSPAVEAVFVRHWNSLRAIYAHYSRADLDAANQAGALLSSREWLRFLKDVRLLDDAFTKREASLCFAWAQMFVSDEVRASIRPNRGRLRAARREPPSQRLARLSGALAPRRVTGPLVRLASPVIAGAAEGEDAALHLPRVLRGRQSHPLLQVLPDGRRAERQGRARFGRLLRRARQGWCGERRAHTGRAVSCGAAEQATARPRRERSLRRKGSTTCSSASRSYQPHALRPGLPPPFLSLHPAAHCTRLHR